MLFQHMLSNHNCRLTSSTCKDPAQNFQIGNRLFKVTAANKDGHYNDAHVLLETPLPKGLRPVAGYLQANEVCCCLAYILPAIGVQPWGRSEALFLEMSPFNTLCLRSIHCYLLTSRPCKGMATCHTCYFLSVLLSLVSLCISSCCFCRVD